MTCGGTLWSHIFFHLLSSRGGGPDDMRGTIWSRTFFTFCHLEAAGPMTCEGTLWSRVFFHLLSFRDSGSDDMRGNLMVPHPFCTIQRQSSPIACEDKLWSSALSFLRYPETIKLDSTRRQIMVIRTLLLSVRLDA